MLVAAGLLAAPVARADDAPDPVVAQRGNITLTASAVRQMIAMADPDARVQMEHDPAFLAQRLRDRLLQLTVLAEAKAHQWDQRPDVAYRAELAREGAIEESYVAAQVQADPNFPTEEQVQAAYDANRGKLLVPKQYHVAQIFLASPQNGPIQQDADALHKANELRAQATKPHADFAALAKTKSDDKTTGPNGGDLGWLREDALAPPIRAAVAALSDGAVSEPVRSQQGWHVLKLLGVRPSTPATFAEAHETIVRAMRQDRQMQGQRTYLSDLMQQTQIQINEIEVSKLVTK